MEKSDLLFHISAQMNLKSKKENKKTDNDLKFIEENNKFLPKFTASFSQRGKKYDYDLLKGYFLLDSEVLSGTSLPLKISKVSINPLRIKNHKLLKTLDSYFIK